MENNSTGPNGILVPAPNPKLVPGMAGTPSLSAEPDKSSSVQIFRGNSIFTKEMAHRAVETGVDPHDFLKSIAVDPTLTFTDHIYLKDEKGRNVLTTIERTATIEERIDCAKAAAPYFAAKKVDVSHSGEITVLHTLAKTNLANVAIDEQGNIIEADFEDVDEELDE